MQPRYMDLLKTIALIVILLCMPIVVAIPDKADLGPFVATFDINAPKESYDIEINPPYQDIDCNIYSFRVDSTENWRHYIDVDINDYGKRVDVSSGRQIEMVQKDLELQASVDKKGEKVDMISVPPSIGGLPAEGGKLINSTDGSVVLYETVYSPDGVGNSGTVLATIYSHYPEKETNAFLEHLRIKKQ